MFNHYRVLETSGLFISRQTKPFYSVEKGNDFILPYHDFVYAHTLYIHTKCVFGGSVRKKKSENLNTACKESERVVKSSIVCVLHSFHAFKGSHYVQRVFWPDFKIIQASSNH